MSWEERFSSGLVIFPCNWRTKYVDTGKSLSEALILATSNPQYDKRLFIDLPVKYMKSTSSEHVVYINCSEFQNKNKKQFVYTTSSELVVFMYWPGESMNNLLSYFGLVDARISTSEKDLPVAVELSHFGRAVAFIGV